jgi:hypothetical protein
VSLAGGGEAPLSVDCARAVDETKARAAVAMMSLRMRKAPWLTPAHPNGTGSIRFRCADQFFVTAQLLSRHSIVVF